MKTDGYMDEKLSSVRLGVNGGKDEGPRVLSL